MSYAWRVGALVVGEPTAAERLPLRARTNRTIATKIPRALPATATPMTLVGERGRSLDKFEQWLGQSVELLVLPH